MTASMNVNSAAEDMLGLGDPPLSVKAAASDYLQRGWPVMRLKHKTKEPALGTHELSTITWDNINTVTERDNIGVRFTERGILKDIDLDYKSAADLAEAVELFTETAAFGRASVGVGHLLYNAPGLETHKFNLPESGKYPKPLPLHDDKPSRCVLEIRGGSDNTYTMFPPSVHPCGETLNWIGERREPLDKEAADIRLHFGRHAFASAVLYFYPTDAAARYEVRMGLAGALIRAGMNADQASVYVREVARLGGDPKWKEDFADHTEKRIEDNKKTTGIPALIKTLQLPEACGRVFREWLDNRTTPKPVALSFSYDDLQATPWAVRGFALRGAVTAFVADGGTGKTQFTIQLAIACALGEDFAGYHPMRPLKTAFVSGEEPREELKRRIAAVVLDRVGNDRAKFDATMKRLDGYLFTFAGKDVALVEKTLDDDGEGQIKETPFCGELQAFAVQEKIDLVFVDPTIRAHSGLDENSSEMQSLHNATDQIATRAHCAVILVHHTRKSSAGNIDEAHASRGSSALTDAARIVVVLANMSKEEGEKFLPPSEREKYIDYCKLGDPKQNYAGRSAAKWFHKKSVELPVKLEDDTPDTRFVLVPWVPTAAGDDVLTALWLPRCLDDIERGHGEGEMYTATTTGPRATRADALLQEKYDVPQKQSRVALLKLERVGILGREMRHSAKARRELRIYVVNRRTSDEIPF
jgi:hypothetical protein